MSERDDESGECAIGFGLPEASDAASWKTAKPASLTHEQLCEAARLFMRPAPLRPAPIVITCPDCDRIHFFPYVGGAASFVCPESGREVYSLP